MNELPYISMIIPGFISGLFFIVGGLILLYILRRNNISILASISLLIYGTWICIHSFLNYVIILNYMQTGRISEASAMISMQSLLTVFDFIVELAFIVLLIIGIIDIAERSRGV